MAVESKAVTTLPPVPDNAHRIVLMRHGESEFNNANVFTGWCDVALTPRGIVEAVEAGQVFASHGIHFAKCYCSLLTRSIVTAQRSLEAAGLAYTPCEYHWRLNERHYGALQVSLRATYVRMMPLHHTQLTSNGPIIQGLGKERTADRLGRSIVMEWRRSYHARPPLMTKEHPHYPIIYNDPRYKGIQGIKLPLGESLEDCQLRVVQAWEDIVQDLPRGMETANDSSYSLIVAHANSLRALVMHLDSIPVDEIEGLNIPTAIPFFYDICLSSGAVLSTGLTEGKFRGTYISDDRKKRNFLERRRAANDPFLWALHDHEVSRRMLIGDEEPIATVNGSELPPEGLKGLEEEAKRNTELFSSTLKGIDK
jgi:2,3-bisphosphoglycerate-dependent phosphoglycerate mutase